MDTNSSRSQFLRWAVAVILAGAGIWSFLIAMSNWWAAQAPENLHHEDLVHYGNAFGALSAIALVGAVLVIWLFRRKQVAA